MRLAFTSLLAATMLLVAPAWGDVIDDTSALKITLDEAAIDLHGGRWTAGHWEKIQQAMAAYGAILSDPEAKLLWQKPLVNPGTDTRMAAEDVGLIEARLQHVAALEMLFCLRSGNVEAAREWRAVILLPKYASAIEGTLALQNMGGTATHREGVESLLAREYVIWQITRAREKSDNLSRLAAEHRANPAQLAGRSTEIQTLANFPTEILSLATGGKVADAAVQKISEEKYQAILRAENPGEDEVNAWRLALEVTYPNLLSEDDVVRREGIMLKLVRLIPKEYQSGVRDGKITIPIEYREAKSFTIQTQQILSELMPVWRQTKSAALAKQGPELLAAFDELENAINRLKDPTEVERLAKKAGGILQDGFGLTVRKAGKASDVIEETALEIRSLLGQSLAAAQEGQWRKAESLRVDAYVNFDLEIESRALPRNPDLALRTERSFLDGNGDQLGIKAALDARLKGEALNSVYATTLEGLAECSALLKVGLSPTAAAIGAMLIILREGLEAVVILAALLAGLRGVENATIRKRIGSGAWLALLASAGLFIVSRSLLQGLSHYGETLEAVISILAVIILLMVTNWVFHKYYWTGWNARLRGLSKVALGKQGTRMENFALVGVGFMTIFREGFETTLFMQSLILEAGLRPVLCGIAVGGALIAAMGFAVFQIGAKLPYRKMLIFTGILVIFVLFTFLGSTVRLFQTVGWLTVHPIMGLQLPTWTGVWLGIYPTWEGLVIPFLSFVYVGGMWLWVKMTSRLVQQAGTQQQEENQQQVVEQLPVISKVAEPSLKSRESQIPSGV